MSQLDARRTPSEREVIEAVLRLYIDGAGNGKLEPLQQAFHPDARMYGELNGGRVDIPVAELFKISIEQPLNSRGNYHATIVSIDHVGGAAVALVNEDGCWGTVSFSDFFSLTRIGRDWKIVSKTFAHTGGTPPPTLTR